MPGTVVVAVGSPIWDTTTSVDEAFLDSRNLPKGDATPFLNSKAFGTLKSDALEISSRAPTKGCGGCACNTAKVLACLGCHTGFCGGIGSDEVASALRQGLGTLGLADLTEASDAATGEVLCFVTPDSERTFAYSPGASASLTCAGLSHALSTQLQIGTLDLVYFDVYTLLCPGDVMEEGMRQAHAMGAKTGLNLGSRSIVTEQRERLWAILRSGLCDVLTLNEAEALALCDVSNACEACASLSAFCELVVLTLGADGVWTSFAGEPVLHKVKPADEVLDSTGAGDFFAGGFLAAWLHGCEASECVRWGSTAATAVLAVFGADLDPTSWERLQVETLGR